MVRDGDRLGGFGSGSGSGSGGLLNMSQAARVDLLLQYTLGSGHNRSGHNRLTYTRLGSHQLCLKEIVWVYDCC